MDVRDEIEEEIKREVTEKNKIEFVQNLLNEKIPDDLICKYVNINSKDLNIIKEKLSNK